MRIFTELKNYVQHQFAHPSGTVEIPFITYSLKPMQQFVTIRISTGVVYGVNNTPYIINTIFKPTVRTHQLRELFSSKRANPQSFGFSPVQRILSCVLTHLAHSPHCSLLSTKHAQILTCLPWFLKVETIFFTFGNAGYKARLVPQKKCLRT